MQKMQEGNSSETVIENAETLREILENLIKLSFNQEILLEKTAQINKENPDFIAFKSQVQKIIELTHAKMASLKSYDADGKETGSQKDGRENLYIQISDVDELIAKIRQLIFTDNPKNRTFRQYIFGFKNDIRSIYFAYRTFLFELQSMMVSLNYRYICDKFVNWNIMLNLLSYHKIIIKMVI